MANHRDRYWGWLIHGLGGLVRMIEQQASEVDPGDELAAKLAEHTQRLQVVAGKFSKPPAPPAEG